MSERDARRGAVVARLVEGELSGAEAGQLLGLGVRQVRRLVQRYRVDGVRGLVHRSVGRRSNRSCSPEVRAQVLELAEGEYGGSMQVGPGQRFGPTLLAEHLASEQGLVVAVSTLRRWLREAGLWGRRRRRRPHRQRRCRAAHFGELVQLDGSWHDWFEGRGPWAMWLSMVDDATGITLARFVTGETTWHAAGLLEAWVQQYGVPVALYTDHHGVYHRGPSSTERTGGARLIETQFGRMCRKLDIRLLAAGSPQAKGRVERNHGTHQDRLVKKLRRAGVQDLEAANRFLPDYLAAHNARFALPAASAADFHRPWPMGRAPQDVFCREWVRVVGQDYVVQCQGQALQLVPHARFRLSPKSKVLVRESADGTRRVIEVDARGAEHEIPWHPAPPRMPKPDPLPTPARPRPTARPKADHPWRRQIHYWAAEQRAGRAPTTQATRAPEPR